MWGHGEKLYSLTVMKNEQKRQETIREILGAYGSIDYLDTVCLAARFKVETKVIQEDIRQVRERVAEEAWEKRRADERERVRAAELAQAKRILRGEG
jgi:hypothetical protein